MTNDGVSRDRYEMGRLVLGGRLRGLRQAAGLTLVQAAAASSLSPNYLSDVERGKKLPTLEALDRLCGVLGVLVVDCLAGVYPFGSSVVPERAAPPPDGRSSGRVSTG